MVFEPAAAPKDHAAFMQWYFELMKWANGPYDDQERTTERLQGWLRDRRRSFPDAEAPDLDRAYERTGDGVLSDYTIGRDFIYAGFAWSKAIEADAEGKRLAVLHGVGFVDVSGPDEDMYLPSPDGLRLAHRKSVSLGSKLRKMLGPK